MKLITWDVSAHDWDETDAARLARERPPQGEYAKVLELWGYSSRCVYDGNAAVTAIREWVPDTVLLDIGLPQLDGFGVMERLRAEGTLARTRVIAMTGYGKEDADRIAAAGFSDHMVKPVNLVQLRGLPESRR